MEQLYKVASILGRISRDRNEQEQALISMIVCDIAQQIPMNELQKTKYFSLFQSNKRYPEL